MEGSSRPETCQMGLGARLGESCLEESRMNFVKALAMTRGYGVMDDLLIVINSVCVQKPCGKLDEKRAFLLGF